MSISDSVKLEGVRGLVERVANADPSRTALLAPGRRPLDYGTLHAFLGSAAAEVNGRGIDPDDRVALVVQNGPEAATGFLALASAATCAPLNPSYSRSEMDFFLDDLKARAVVVSRDLDSPVRQSAAERGIPVLELEVDAGGPAGCFSLQATGATRAAVLRSRRPEDVALLLHTSGTTSRPKLVPLTQRNLVTSARHVSETLALGPSDRCLNLMPLFHIHGLVAALLASLHGGGSVACTPGFHQIRVFDWLTDLKPTWITAVPTMHQLLLARCADHEGAVRDHRLRFIRSSSAALPTQVFQDLERTFGVPVIEAYGMTEAAHQMASNRLPPGRRRAGSVGQAAGPEIAILSPTGELLRVGSVGEVAIRGENVFSGYEGNPEANAAAFVSGWFRTGDQGTLDEQGYLTLSGRFKEQINRAGEKISPLEVDERLLAHPAVAEAVAFGMADAQLGEEIAAAVVLKPGADAGEAALQEFVAQTLAPYKVPRRILVVDAIPKGPTGKIQRIELADRLGLLDLDDEPSQHVEPRTAFERSVAAIWARVLGTKTIGIHDDFFSHGGDSILGAEAVAQMRELMGFDDLPLVSIVRAPTVAGMVREMDREVGALARSGPIALYPQATGEPFFFIHGGDGEVLPFVSLARAVGVERSVFGIRARGIDDGAEPCASIEEMAAEYLDAMRSIQARGPYALGGFCFGGAVALEMARQLAAAGETVSLLLLVDPRLKRPDGLRFDVWLSVRRFHQKSLLRSIGRRILRRPKPDPADGAPSEIERSIARLRETYEPRPYLGRSVLILSDGHALHEIPAWYLKTIVPNAQTIRLPIGHSELVRSPGVDTLAREIRSALVCMPSSGH